MNTHYDRVLTHLKNVGSITSLEAIQKYGLTRLSAIIYNLRKDGYIITSKNETSKNRYGRKVTYSRYYLKENNYG